jgi:formylmethanofuran dehydrogenase subunit E
MAIAEFPHPKSFAPAIRTGLDELLAQSAAGHSHLCPRQVLGVRMGLLALDLLQLSPRELEKKKLFTIVETDGCFMSGIVAATGTSPNRRTMRLFDYGKIAATFINRTTQQAVRIRPSSRSRSLAWDFCPSDETRRYFAMLHGYRHMPAELLFEHEAVGLRFSLSEWLSVAGVRSECSVCGEEIVNQREIYKDGYPVCRPCGRDSYYAAAAVQTIGGSHE